MAELFMIFDEHGILVPEPKFNLIGKTYSIGMLSNYTDKDGLYSYKYTEVSNNETDVKYRTVCKVDENKKIINQHFNFGGKIYYLCEKS